MYCIVFIALHIAPEMKGLNLPQSNSWQADKYGRGNPMQLPFALSLVVVPTFSQHLTPDSRNFTFANNLPLFWNFGTGDPTGDGDKQLILERLIIFGI